jgi:hypothetical protein
VSTPTPVPLRLFVEEPPAEPPELDLTLLGSLSRAFEQATGWELRCERSPAVPGEVWSTTIDSPGKQRPERLVLGAAGDRAESGEIAAALDLHRARPLALAIGNLLGEVNRLRHALWQREAELAAGVPVAARPDSEPHLAERLEAVLKGGAEAVGCQAAGLYLLDEHTSQLKLRAAFNLPPERLLAEARPLRGAVADLEALVGHAVVLEDTSLTPHWRCPEEFPAAVCVPVSSPTAPLGTLWIYSERPRDFSPQETNLIEIVAGRLAADLEREMLLAAGVESRQDERQLQVASRWLAQRLPSVAPLVEGYEVAGWTQPARGVSGSFHDWSVLPDGRLALAVGESAGSPIEAALGVVTLQAALKSHAGYRHSAAQMLARVNDTLYAASPGDQRAGLAYALVDADRGAMELALAGNISARFLGSRRGRVIKAKGPLLAESSDAVFRAHRAELESGAALVLLASGSMLSAGAAAAIDALGPSDSAGQIMGRLQELLTTRHPVTGDISALVLKRTR